MIDVDFVAQRYGILPSQIAKMDIREFDLDLTVAMTAMTWEQKMREKSAKGANIK